MATLDDVASILVNGTTESLSRIGKNEASRSLKSQSGAAGNKHRNVAAKTVSRRDNSTKGVSRSSYLQSIEDAAGMGSANNTTTTQQDYAKYLRQDDGYRREMCSSPRLHPGIQLERLKDYQADRGNQLGKLIKDESEFAKIQLKDDGTSLPGTAPIEQAWTPRETRDVPLDDPLALKCSARGDDNKQHREERKKPGSYYTGRKPVKFNNPGVGHYRPKYEQVEYRMTGGYICSPRSSADTPRGLLQQQQQQELDDENNKHDLPTSGRNANNSNTFNVQQSASGDYMEQSGRVDSNNRQQQGRGSPTQTVGGSSSGSPTHGNNMKVMLDPKSHGDVSKRPPFGTGSGYVTANPQDNGAGNTNEDGSKKNSGNTGPQAGNKPIVENASARQTHQISVGPEAGDYWPRPIANNKRTNYCFVDMSREKQNIDRNPPAIPSVDIAYPAAEGIMLSLKSRTPRAFIAPKKPGDPAAHASKVVGHHAESAWVANGVQKSGNNNGSTNGSRQMLAPVEGDRLDIDPYRSKDSLVKHSASMVDFKRSAKKSDVRVVPTTTLTADVELYDGRPAPSTKRAVNPVNMDKMSGRPPVQQAHDVRISEVNDELIHTRPRVPAIAPLQPENVQIRMSRLRAEREGVPRLCGAADVSPVRPRVGGGAVDFTKSTARKDPTSGSLDLVYENLDPHIVSTHKHSGGDPHLATQVSRNKREQLTRPKWGALDRIYDKERGEKLTQHHTNTLYAFDKRVDRDHAFSGAMASEAFLKRTNSDRPGPGQYLTALSSDAVSPGRSFTTARK